MPDLNSIHRHCAACKKTLKGRRDKKFCNDACRNNYNNFLKSTRNRLVRTINAILERNRRIMQQLLPERQATVTVNKETLARLGFQFRYFTHTYITKKEGKVYYYCYDHGYLPLENNRYLIVREIE